MVNPQIEDGYTRIANEILEAMAKINLTSYQLRILMVVWRKTYGWGKKADWISQSQMVEMTGIQKSHVSRTLKELKDRRIITKNSNRIAFNKNYSEWKGLRRKVTNPGNYRKKKAIPLNENYNESKVLDGKVTNPGNSAKDSKKVTNPGKKVTNSGNKKLPIQGHTKEKKETIQKKEDCLSFSIKEKNEKERIKRIAKKYELTFDEVSSFENYIGKIQREESLSFDVALSVGVNNYIFNQLGKQK